VINRGAAEYRETKQQTKEEGKKIIFIPGKRGGGKCKKDEKKRRPNLTAGSLDEGKDQKPLKANLPAYLSVGYKKKIDI